MSGKSGIPVLASRFRPILGNPASSLPAAVGALALTAVYCVLPLLVEKSIPLGHDTGFHIFQSFQFLQGLENGSFYPRWAADANNGYGSPNFIFYSPMAYYLISFIHLWEPSAIMSMTYAIWTGFFLSGVSMLIAARKMFGIPGSLLSAVVYQMFPFHLINLYFRGTFGELLAYSWLPLFLCFLMDSPKSGDSRANLVGLSLSYAALVLSHLATAFIFSLVAGAYLLYGIILVEEKKALFRKALMLAIGLGISSVYLGPAVLERKFIHMGVMSKYIYTYAGIFLFDSRAPLFEIFFRFLYVTVLLEAVFFLSLVLISRKSSSAEMRADTDRFLVPAFIASFLLTTPLSGPVWNWIPQFPVLQFPWRWIIVMEVSLCFLIARTYSFERVQEYKPARLLKSCIVIILVLFAQLPMQNTPSGSISEREFLELKRTAQWRNVTDEKPEYMPLWANLDDIWSRKRDDRVRTTSGNASSRVTEWSPESRAIEVRAFSDSLIRISTYYYPGWEGTLDGAAIPMDVEKGTGVLLVPVSKGDHTIRATFRDTRPRKIAKYTSLISLLFLIPGAMFFGGRIGSKGRSPSE